LLHVIKVNNVCYGNKDKQKRVAIWMSRVSNNKGHGTPAIGET